MIDAPSLRALDAAGLAALLRRRPDVVEPPEPASLAELADRLDQPVSVVAALRRLDRPTLQVAEALAALGGEAGRSDLDRLLGVAGSGGAADVDRALDTLREHALLDGSTQRPQLAPAAAQAWERPLGLGWPAAEALAGQRAEDLRTYARNLGLRPATRKADLAAQLLTALRDPELILRLVQAAPAPVRRLLMETARSGEPVPDPQLYLLPRQNREQEPTRWAVSRGLLIRRGGWDGVLEMPAEVAMALRGTGWTAPFDPVPPRPPARIVPAEVTARDAAAAGAAALRVVSALADEAGRSPVTVLKAGGVGTRELRRLAKLTGATEPEVRLGLAVAQAAGLLAFTELGLAPTAGYDDWLRDEPAPRLAALLTAWWRLPYVPTGEEEGAWPPAPRWPGVAPLRAAVLDAASSLPLPDVPAAVDPAVPADPPVTGTEPTGPGGQAGPTRSAGPGGQAGSAGSVGEAHAAGPVASIEPEELAALVLWSRPLAFDGPDPRRRIAACWVEAGMLGVAGAGALGPAGRALRAGADIAAVLTGLGNTERRVRIQADLTAVVAGTPAAGLTELLDATAERESRGAASTWRFTPESVRRAFDTGRRADALLDELAAAAVGGVPQPLEYLVRDVWRRHGTVRGQEVACCLRSEDASLLAQIAADRRLRGLGLRVLAPTVLAGAKPLAETLAGLREAGYAPVAERADGTPVLEEVRPHRAYDPRRASRAGKGRKATGRAADGRTANGRTAGTIRSGAAAGQSTPAPPSPDELARALLARPDAVAPPPSASLSAVRQGARQLTEGPARILAHAIDTGTPVQIDYVNQAGNVTRRVIEDIDLSGTVIMAWCRLREDERMFNLGRILGVASVGS